MSKIYVMSDIHGYYDAMIESLELVDLNSSKDDKLILLGDYVDYGNESYKVLKLIMKLEKEYPEQVIVLLGNHEEMFYDLIYGASFDYESVSYHMDTITSFFSKDELESIYRSAKIIASMNGQAESNVLISEIMYKIRSIDDFEITKWLSGKMKEKRYFETDKQIFVHAGVDEDAGENWKVGMDENALTRKSIASIGKFYKYVIAGHISSAEVAGNENYLGKIYFDNESHFYIDGNAKKTGKIPVLVYDDSVDKYYTYDKGNDGVWTLEIL